MLKKIFSFGIAIFLGLIGLVGNVLANNETFTASSNMNGIIVNWEYRLNEANQIIDLKCTNPTALIGNIVIPTTLEGKTVVSLGSEAFKVATEITQIKIPSSVTEIENSAFKNCTKLNKVDLGNITNLSFGVFEGCTSLTEIKIPKTLKLGSVSPCLDNPNITSIILEEGLTKVPSYLCANTGITEIKIPSSVTEIDHSAFKNCTKLNKVDLGNITNLSFGVFEGCTSLTEIKIPKTLKLGSVSPCLDNPNITSIILEEGLTKVPSYLCANTGITEIKIPSSVTEIENSAFKNCTKLKKITILDNVTKMSFITKQEESIFQNHDNDLTIYCYKDSMAANYAIKYNIKYVYLKKLNTNEGSNNDNSFTIQKNTSITDSTLANGKLPEAGISITIGIGILTILVIAIISYKKNQNYKDIK